MQPNDSQGLQPDQGQPVAPFTPAQPTQIVQTPVAQPPTNDPAAAVQAALDEAGPATAPAPTPTTTVAPSAPIEAEGVHTEDDDAEDQITWSAQEAVHHEKGAMWFVLFTVLMLGLLGLSIWTQAWSFAVLILVITVVVFIFAKRPPRELAYSLSDDGFSVDGRAHKYDEFKAFGVIKDGEDYSVMLIPVQRLQPGLTMYFPEELGEDIVDILGSHLQMKELKLDAVDRMAKFFRL